MEIKQEQIWAMLNSQGWELLQERLVEECRLLECQQHSDLDLAQVKNIDNAVKTEAALRKIKWVIELPHTMIKEFAKSGDTQ